MKRLLEFLLHPPSSSIRSSKNCAVSHFISSHFPTGAFVAASAKIPCTSYPIPQVHFFCLLPDTLFLTFIFVSVRTRRNSIHSRAYWFLRRGDSVDVGSIGTSRSSCGKKKRRSDSFDPTPRPTLLLPSIS